MASNREERLQMRQRGAGTRKIQALDFGFSFGSPPPVSQSNQGAPEGTITNNIDSVVTEAGAHAETLPNATPPVNNDSTTKSPTNNLRASNTPVRSPRLSARTSINRVPSALNPTNDAQEEAGRSSKRRRISTENERSTPASASKKSTRIASTSPAITHADGLPDSPQTGITVDEGALEPTTATSDGVGGHVEQEAEAEPEPAQEVVKTSRKGRAKTITSPNEVSNARTREADERPRSKPGRRRSAVNGTDPPVDNGEGPSRLPNRKRRQPAKANDVEDEHESESGSAAPQPNKRRQKRKDIREASEREQESDRENNESTQQASRGGRKSLGQPARNVEPEPEEDQEDDNAAQARRRRKGKQKVTGTEVEGTEDVAVAQSSKEKQTGKQQQQPRESAAGPRRRGHPSLDKEQQEPQPEAETTTNNAPETSTEPVQPAKRRGRRQQRDDTQEPGKRLQGTVSITVHRLVNTEVLDSAQADADSSDHEQDSSDEQLEAAGKKFPSRTGVNAADVLSQICKEILDKHITALTANIANDTASNNNQSKRAEYARQRKAVEAYGTQLEGRLFELSELLDSNFALGVQLKKAKREAAEIRNRLLAVRQQRHEVTLRMDAVRRKHGEEENAKMSRNAINNALHNLELTLDRNRRDGNGEEKETGIAGLEFLLRSVSENVSSAAEGSQGGLLSQVKAFNAQLERAAKKLER